MQENNMRAISGLSILLLFLLAQMAFTGSHAFSNDTDNEMHVLFDEASSLYFNSDFNSALEAYLDILQSGYESPALYYNMGNTYLKLGLLGNAILSYERALKNSPYDADIKANLLYANSLTKQPSMDSAAFWLNRKIDYIMGLFTIDGLTIMLSVLYALFFICLCFLVLSRNAKAMRNTASAIVVIFVIVTTFLALKIYGVEYIDRGIILENAVDSRYEPLDEASVHFKLYEGSKIVVLKSKGGWSQIKRQDNKIGWIKSDAYGII
jgi:tetratricopeptide (TPR) repeat protein